MDFDIGTFIYILLTLVFIIIGTLGGRKKAQISAPPPDEEADDNSQTRVDPFTEDFKKLFGELNEPLEEEVNKEDYREEPETVKSESDVMFDRTVSSGSLLDKPGNMEGMSDLYKMEDHIDEIMKGIHLDMVTPSSGRSTFVKRAFRDFDPRKGILYAEVFQPKYF